jgi:hypothetical protein
VSLVFDIFQGIGIAAAVGIRPFLPGLAAGALAAGDVELSFAHTNYDFLQSSWFLLVLLIGTIALVVLERSLLSEGVRQGPGAYALAALALAIGGAFFAGELARAGDPVWIGWVAGVACAAVGLLASRPFLRRLRERLDAAAAQVGLPLIGEGSALLVAVLSVVVPPVGVLALLALLWLVVAGRRREDRKYAGLRILR